MNSGVSLFHELVRPRQTSTQGWLISNREPLQAQVEQRLPPEVGVAIARAPRPVRHFRRGSRESSAALRLMPRSISLVLGGSQSLLEPPPIFGWFSKGTNRKPSTWVVFKGCRKETAGVLEGYPIVRHPPIAKATGSLANLGLVSQRLNR